MDARLKLEQSIKELRRLTGLPLELDFSGEIDLSRAEYQLSTLCNIYKGLTNQEVIFRRWLLCDLSYEEFFTYASRLHIKAESRRGLFLIKFNKEMDSEVITILKNIFLDTESTIFSLRKNQYILIREFSGKRNHKNINEMKDIAYEISNILNTELMEQVHIAYSQITEHINQLQEAYQEALLTLQIGELFYPEHTVYAYNELGVGSLLYNLPKDVCMKYIYHNLGEYFLENDSILFEKDILETADCFLRCNLNIAETSRQLHIHRNTLLYRLEQIQNETGLDIRKFDAAMTFKLSSMILQFLGSDPTTKGI